jgi:GNAT superfamily N-acetyltransferase
MDGRLPTETTTASGARVRLTRTVDADHAELHALFSAIVATGEGYPHDPTVPLDVKAFTAYWLEPATTTVVARRLDDGDLVGAYTMRPNGPGRAAHVANAGYIVAAPARGAGIGTVLVEHSMALARAEGFDALQFNFVFASNPARRLYERLGFVQVGEVPDVIDGDAVCIYWRRL